MTTRAVISKIKAIQAALSVIATLNINAPRFPPDSRVCNGTSYDYVIVGGGTSGSIVAGRLVEAGYSVLVIEAGGLPRLESYVPGMQTYLKNSPADWQFPAEDDGCASGCIKPHNIAEAKSIGGVGTTDLMFYNRGNPSNYDNLSKDGSWSWANLMKYFKKSESLKDPTILNSPYRKYHGIDGKIAVTRESRDVCDAYIKRFGLAGEPTPLDNVGNGSLGYSRSLYFINNGYRTSARAYITPLKDNPKLQISLYSLATKIIFDDKKNAIGVEFIKNGKKIIVKAKKEVIVSAGPLKSPQLLMLSGIGPKKYLKQFNITCLSDLPVGQNLQNIVGVYLVHKTNKKAEVIPFNVHVYPMPLIIGKAATNKSSNVPNYEVLGLIIDDYDWFLGFCGYTLNFKNKICDQLYCQGKNTQLLATILININIKSRGQILLKSTKPEDPPKVITGYYSDEKDIDAVVEEIQDYMKVVSSPYFKDIGLEFLDASNCRKYEKGSEEYWKCYARCMMTTTNRFVGTNSIDAVVDSKLRVKGINKLRVVDASVISQTITGSVVLMAVSEKASDMIISDAESM